MEGGKGEGGGEETPLERGRDAEDRRWERGAVNAVPEELTLAVMFVVTPTAVAFFDCPPPDFLSHLDVHGGRAPEKKRKKRLTVPEKRKTRVFASRPKSSQAFFLRKKRNFFFRKRIAIWSIQRFP